MKTSRHLVKIVCCLSNHASLPLKLLCYALQTAMYLINQMTTLTLNKNSLLEVLFHCPLNYSKLKVFSYLCFPWLTPYTTNKLQTKSKPCIFLGYSLAQSAYLCYDLSKSKLFTSRHVELLPLPNPSFINSNDSSSTLSPQIFLHIQSRHL